MNLFKKLRKGMSVLLVACMVAGMVFNTSATPVYAEESGGTVTTGQGSNSVNQLADGQETEPTVADNDISKLTSIDLFKETVPLGSKLTVAGKDTHVLSIDKPADNFKLSLAFKGIDKATWEGAYGMSDLLSRQTPFTPKDAPEDYTPNPKAEDDDIDFYNFSNRMLSVEDVKTLGDKLTALDEPYWLDSEVVGTKDGKRYSVAAYVAEDGSVDIADKITSMNVYVKTNTDKVKYIYSPADMEVTGWTDASSQAMPVSESSSTGYAALYAGNSADAAGVELTKYTGSVSNGVYNIVADMPITATCPADTDKVLVAVLNEQGGVVAYNVVDVADLAISTTVPDVVGRGSLKLIAFSSTDGEVKGESEYEINVAAQQDLVVKLAEAVDDKLALTLDFKDATNSSDMASSKADIKLAVTESNYYDNPESADDFVLLTESNANVVTGDNIVTSVQISGYKDSTLTVTSSTDFTGYNMDTYAAEKNVYLYYYNNNVLTLAGEIDIARQYTSTFAYDNTKSEYTYGDISSKISETTHANENLSMDIVEGGLKGVSQYLSSVEEPDVVNQRLADLVWTSRKGEFDENQFAYTNNVMRVEKAINVGTYTTQSHVVALIVYADGTLGTTVETEKASNEVFRFIIHNTGERTFEIVPRAITLTTKDQTVKDTEKLSTDAANVGITDADDKTYTLTYGDVLTVNLAADADKNITFGKLSADKEYKIVNGETDVTYNYNVTLSETYGKLITTSLSAKLYADGSEEELPAAEEGSYPTHTDTYNGETHSVTAKPGIISDAANAVFEEDASATVNYEWKLDNPSEADAKTADFTSTGTTVPTFTNAGRYLVKYTVTLNGYNDYVGYYYVDVKQKEVTVTIADQTYQYTNEAGKSYFKQFGDEDNLISVSENGLLSGDSITEITLKPVLADGAITGIGKITADVTTVKVSSGDVDKTNNYAITIVDGQLIVEKAVVTVDIGDVSEEYKGSAYTINPKISATYKDVETGIDDKNETVEVYYYSIITSAFTFIPDKSLFTTELPDLTTAGERTVYYYAKAEGYKDSAIKSFTVNITKKALEITLKNQSVTYPMDITAAFDSSKDTEGKVASVTGLITGHAVSGNIAKSEDTSNDAAIYKTGTLSVAKKTDADALDVTVVDKEGNNVTANYAISDVSNSETSTATYTIAKNSFNAEQVVAESYSEIYSRTYDAESHNAVKVTPDATVFDSEKDKIYYCLDGDNITSNNVWSESVPQVKNAGTYVVDYKVVKEGYNDYIGSVTVEIQKADLSLYVSPQNASVQNLVLKTDAANSLTYVTPIGLKGTDKIDSVEFYSEELANSKDGTVTNGTIDVKTNEDGIYAVFVKNGKDDVTANYKITSVGNSLTVKKGSLKVTADSKNVTYDANAHNILELLTINGKSAVEAMAEDASITVECSTDGIKYVPVDNYSLTTPGTLSLYYKVTAKGYNAYESSTPVTLTVNKKPLSITIPDQKVTYGEAFDAKGYTIDETDLLEGHTLDKSSFALTVDLFENGAVTGTTVIKNNGKIKITDGSGANVTDCYELVQDGAATYTVNAAEFTDEMFVVTVEEDGIEYFPSDLTESGVTKDYKAEAYNVEIKSTKNLAGYKVTYSINGGEAADSLALINAGIYNVKATVSATGYTDFVVEFTYTINPQKINVVLAPQTITYGEDIAQPTGNYGNIDSSNSVFTSITGLQGGDTITVGKIVEADGKLTLDVKGITVNYANTDCTGKDNYTIVVDNTDAILTVNQRAVTITAEDQSIKDAEVAVTDITSNNAKEYISVAGLAEGDYIAEAKLSKGDNPTVKDSFTDEYALSVESVVIKNSEDTDVTAKYEITKKQGKLSVESMPITISDNTAEYDGKAHGAKITVADGYSFDLTKATLEYEGVTDVTDGETISVTVSADGYLDMTADVKVTVTKRQLLIKALAQDDLELGEAILQVGDTTSDGKTAVSILRGQTAGADQVAVAEITGLVSGQNVTGIKLVADTSTSGSSPITVNSDELSITDGNDVSTIGNYNITYFAGSVYVNPATITISIDGKEAGALVQLGEHTYNGKSPLDSISINPEDAVLDITVNGNSVADLDKLKAATVNAGSYTVVIKATKKDYTNAQTTIVFNIAKAAALEAQAVGIDENVRGVIERKDNVYDVPVPQNNYTSYELAVSVTSGGADVDASNYSISYSLDDDVYSDKLELTAAGKYTVYYKVIINTDNFANAEKVINGSQNITVCDHSDATFTKEDASVYTCDKCGGTVVYIEYQVVGVATTVTNSADKDNYKISASPSQHVSLINESYGPNAEVVLDATSYKTGTNVFLGWYSKSELSIEGAYYSLKGKTPKSTSLRWVYKADLNMNNQSDSYIAVFRENIQTVTLTATAPSTDGTVQITVNDVTTEAADTVTKSDIVLGSKVTVTATADDTHKFAYWTSESGVVLSDSEEYTFSLTGDTTVKAVFIENGKVTVNTYNKYGQSIDTQSYTAGSEETIAEIIDAPAVLDYAFTGWKLELVKEGTVDTSNEYKLIKTGETKPQPVEGGEYADVDAIKAALKAAIADIVKNSANENCEVKLTALYQEAYKESFTVTVEGGIITNVGSGSETSTQLNAKTAITVQANKAPEGKKFESWRVNGEIVSYNEVYSFYASEAITVTACYVEDSEPVEVKATTDMTKVAIISSTDTSNTFSFTSTATVPEGCTIEKTGMLIWRKTAAVANISELGVANLEKGLSSSATTCNYTYSFSISKSKSYVVYLQSFVDYVNENGERNTIKGKYYKVVIPVDASAITMEEVAAN